MNQIQVFQTLLNQWNLQYESLKNILDEEQKALETRNFSQLEAAVKQKNKQVKEINLLQDPTAMDQSKISISTINKLRGKCKDSPLLSENWKKLIDLVGQCHFKNEVNARMIELMTVSTKRTFNLIKGFDPDNNIYNAKGSRAKVTHFGQPLSA